MIDSRIGPDGYLYMLEYEARPFHYKRLAEVQWLPENMISCFDCDNRIKCSCKKDPADCDGFRRKA